ncbi:MAG: helical backbone metal receptor [Oscillospiraceae bacterium]|nr:helical backbone metal receptor [Oscillospiraceae bacterium]
MYRFRKINRFSRAAVIAAVTAASLAMMCGCTEIDEDVPAPVMATAVSEKPYPVNAGAFVFEGSPQTVGSLSPALTEIICELGFADRLTGRSEYCVYPESVSDRAVLGSAANPDVDAIIEAAPELLISLSPIAKKDITAIEAAGTRVWIISPPESVGDLYRCYEDIAAVFGGKLNCAAAAEDALEPLKKAVNDAKGSMDSFVYIMSPQLAAASDSTFAGNFFSCFGENAAGKKSGGDDISMTTEELLALDPQWIILPDSISIYELPEETSGLSAIKSGRVIVLDNEALERIERPTSRLDGAVYKILEQIEEIGNSGNGISSDSEEE